VSEKSPPVFFLPAAAWREPLELLGPEAAHAARVLRLAPGDNLRLIDGEGRTGLCRIDRVDKNRLRLRLIEERRVSPPATRLHLAPAFSKSARRGYLIEKAAELGAFGLIFWKAARSQGDMPEAPKDSWLAQAAAGAKQSANAFVPRLETAPSLEALIARAQGFDARFAALEPAYGAAAPTPGDLLRPGDAILVLGPEGGLTRTEAETLVKAGFAPLSLGPNVLRLETAALAALSLWHWARAQPEPGHP
jgi:16S rRNA (uracil1498-N3)-methyltransferase